MKKPLSVAAKVLSVITIVSVTPFLLYFWSSYLISSDQRLTAQLLMLLPFLSVLSVIALRCSEGRQREIFMLVCVVLATLNTAIDLLYVIPLWSVS